MKKLIFFLAACLSFASPDNALKLYESGMAFIANDNFSHALRELSVLVEKYPQSEYTDDALLAIGKHYFNTGEKETSFTYFENIVTNYKTSDSSDDAALFLGRLSWEKGQITESYNYYSSIKDAYTNSNVLDEAFYGLAEISMYKKQYKKALYFLSKIYTRFSESDIYENALKKAAYCYYKIGKTEDALKVLASLNERADADTSDETSLLLRFFQNKKYSRQSNYYELESPEHICTDNAGTFYFSTTRDTHIMQVSAKQSKRKNTTSEVTSLFYSENQGLCYSVEGRIYSSSVPSGKSFAVNGEPLTKINSFYLDPFGNYFVFDSDTDAFYSFDSNGKVIRKKAYGRVDFIRYRNDGHVFFVSDSRRSITVRDANGQTVKQLSGFEKILDIAFDTFDNVYILCDKGESLKILTHNFQTFQVKTLRSLNPDIRRYNGVCVDRKSDVYLTANKDDRVIRMY